MKDKVWAYHEATKHRLQAYAPSPGFLDWDSQPDPFRRYEGAPTTPLLFAPRIMGTGFDQIFTPSSPETKPWCWENIGALLGLSFGLSGWKSLGPDRWAMRQNPSSGNLHPTEVYLLSWAESPDAPAPGVYHYDVYNHALEQRTTFSPDTVLAFQKSCSNSFGAIGLSSVLWREEWKYGARALRYCQLDIGHAMANGVITARGLGWTSELALGLSEEDLSKLLGLTPEIFGTEAEPERPEAVLLLGSGPLNDLLALPTLPGEWTGTPTKLSAESLQWPESRKVSPALIKPAIADTDELKQSDDGVSHPPYEDLAILMGQRRSAQRMDKSAAPLDGTSFRRMLDQLLSAQALTEHWAGLPLKLGFYIHNVQGLEPGRYGIDPGNSSSDLQHLDNQPRDIRRETSKLCCTQGIAGHGYFAIVMFADLAAVMDKNGPWAYCAAHWQGGFLGQYLYLAAENLGLSGTGIGCFLDDEVRNFWGFGSNNPWQPLYHFTVGKAKPDNRLVDEQPFGHLSQRLQPVDQDQLKTEIASTWARREAVKASIDMGETPKREGLARLERIDRLLSELDSAFKTAWDTKQVS